MEELSCGGGKRSNLVMVGVGGPYDNHNQIVSFATSYGDAERANVSGSLIVGAFLVLHS